MNMQTKILVTGATGNVGRYVAEHLIKHQVPVVAAMSRPNSSKEKLPEAECRRFDFGDISTYEHALEGVGKVFLIRPPVISDPNAFKPFIERCSVTGITHIVFLSLRGIERNPFPPHYKMRSRLGNRALLIRLCVQAFSCKT